MKDRIIMILEDILDFMIKSIQILIIGTILALICGIVIGVFLLIIEFIGGLL